MARGKVSSGSGPFSAALRYKPSAAVVRSAISRNRASEVLDAAVSLGGDTLACAAAAGAIAGTRFGKAGIPQALLDKIDDPERIATFVEKITPRFVPPLADP